MIKFVSENAGADVIEFQVLSFFKMVGGAIIAATGWLQVAQLGVLDYILSGFRLLI